ncbi:MAG: hypothetical protein Q8N04_17970 [Nitrospira sp.]|nr:hypothetical protein [Nitrospira sp.]
MPNIFFIVRVTLTVLVPGVLMLASCAQEFEEYLQVTLDQATQNDIAERVGPPVTERTDANGNTVWIYEYRVNRPIPVCRDIPASDCVRGKQECTAYHLTFNREKILRSWTTHLC